jgi:hypothetical protein
MDVAHSGTAWFSQNFTGQLMRKPEGRPAQTAWAHPLGAEVGAVSAQGKGTTFATTGNKGRTTLRILQDGTVRILANLSRYEAQHNPDAEETYGLTGLGDGCDVAEELQPYTGIVESHPYATAVDHGTRYVADAAGNAILAVAGDGTVSTAAVLPPQSVEVTQEVATNNDLPDCAVGATAHLEAVPTDVEVGPDGMLYVTSLPGELLQAGSGQVLSVDPQTGAVDTVASGLIGATGLAVGPTGDIFVAELFGGRISRIPAGGSAPQPWTNANMPADVEYADGSIWATRKALTGLEGGKPAGQLVRYDGGIATPAR